MTNSNVTRIGILVDRSGSMESIHDAIINGLNEFVGKLKAQPGRATLKLCQFDDQYDVLFDRPLDQVPILTSKDCSPRGMTALYDAQGRMIEELGLEIKNLPEAERPGKVILMTMTDGLNNASRDFTQAQVAQMIKHQHDVYNWECLYLGANQDAVQIANRINIPRGSTLTYAANYAGTTNALRSASGYVVRAMAAWPNVADPSAPYFSAEFTEQDRSGALIDVDAQNQAGQNQTSTATTAAVQEELANQPVA